MTSPADTAAPFPDERSLCERCGYPLKGLPPGDRCPECGTPVDDSHPRHRTGPAMHSRVTPATLLATASALVTHPAATFRRLRIDGPNLPPRLFMLTVALLTGLLWGIGVFFLLGRSGVQAWLEGMLAVKAVVGLTYVEVLGVAYFSRQRGWRVPLKLAERITCYAALGWLPAAAVILVVYVADARGAFDRLWTTGALFWPSGRVLLYCLIASVAMLGFEMLVWLGVRQARFANGPE